MDLAGGVGEAEGEEGQVRGLGPEAHAAGADGGEWSIGADVRAAGAEVAGQFARAGAGVVVGGVETETAGRSGEFAAWVESPGLRDVLEVADAVGGEARDWRRTQRAEDRERGLCGRRTGLDGELVPAAGGDRDGERCGGCLAAGRDHGAVDVGGRPGHRGSVGAQADLDGLAVGEDIAEGDRGEGEGRGVRGGDGAEAEKENSENDGNSTSHADSCFQGAGGSWDVGCHDDVRKRFRTIAGRSARCQQFSRARPRSAGQRARWAGTAPACRSAAARRGPYGAAIAGAGSRRTASPSARPRGPSSSGDGSVGPGCERAAYRSTARHRVATVARRRTTSAPVRAGDIPAAVRL